MVDDKSVAGQCAVGYDDGMLRVFELTARKMIVKCQPHNTAVSNICYSITGQYCTISYDINKNVV